MINLDKTPINTIVVKRDDFSSNDLLKMRNRKLNLDDKKVFGPVNVKIVFIYPSGHTEIIQTNSNLFSSIIEGDSSCFIYGKLSDNGL